MGDLTVGPPPLVRLHRECLTGDVFGSGGCDCRLQLDGAMARIADEGRGAIVYLRTGAVPGIGLVADSHEHSIGTQILADLGAAEARHLDVGPAPIAVLA
jgi:GTP cyclohydrolase II